MHYYYAANGRNYRLHTAECLPQILPGALINILRHLLHPISGDISVQKKRMTLPEHNEGICLVPQILTNREDDFLLTVKKLKQYGYEEVNLNLGCPSKTVVSKFRGSGFLAKPEELDRFLESIFSKADIKISIKTRLEKMTRKNG